MSRTHDREPPGQTPEHRRRTPRSPAQQADGTEHGRLASLAQAAGNAAVSRMLEPETSHAIESELGGGRALRDLAAAGPISQTREGADVRLHDDAESASLAKGLDAVAFTFGRDIFLAGDAPALDSPEGERVLAHEMTHVEQQGNAPPGAPKRVSSPDSPAEREAYSVGDRAGAEAAAPTGAVHRQGEMEEEELELMAADTVHRQGDEEEEIALMAADTVHRQGEQEEEELELMAAETVHRATAVDEDESDADTLEPSNPALAAMFETTVMRPFDTAIDNLEPGQADPVRAHDSIVEAWSNLTSLGSIYEESDPLLHADIHRALATLGMYQETLVPMFSGPRSIDLVQGSMRDGEFRPLATNIRDRLH